MSDSSPRRVLLSWSSGKDSAWALHLLRGQPGVELVGLITTFNEVAGRVAMHAVRRELVERQAASAGLPLWKVDLPYPCSNADYEARMRALIERAQAAGVTDMAFGDLFLEDVRDYRVRMMAGTGLNVMFPLWGTPADTAGLARTMIGAGLKAVLTCVDPGQLDERFVGRAFDDALLTELPAGADACGERGEFHSFCWNGPMFASPIEVEMGEIVRRDGFTFIDVRPAGGDRIVKGGDVALRIEDPAD